MSQDESFYDETDSEDGLFAFAPPSLSAPPAAAAAAAPPGHDGLSAKSFTSSISAAEHARPTTAAPGLAPPRPSTSAYDRPWTAFDEELPPPQAAAKGSSAGSGPARASTAPSKQDAADLSLTPAEAYASLVYSGGQAAGLSHKGARRRSGLGEPTTPTGSSPSVSVDFNRWRGKSEDGSEDQTVFSSAQERMIRGEGLGRSMRAEVGIEMGRLGRDSLTTKSSGSDGELGQPYLTDAEILARALAEEEEDSAYPEVRASVSNYDDVEMPVLTFRSWFLGLTFAVLVGCANCFMMFRYPAPIMTPIVCVIAAYPSGKFLAWALPITSWTPPSWMGYDGELSFNPGPFNIKEHTVILLMSNVAISPVYALHFSVACEKFYEIKFGAGFDILAAITSQTIGFAVAGLCRRFLVWPASLLWPQNLALSTLLNTLHAEEDNEPGAGISRHQFFCWAFVGAFAWNFLPGYLFQALSAFSWVCWIAPSNPVVNQLFGVSSGLGMSLVTFDWSQIAFIVSPLLVPWWGIVNIFLGFVALYWIIAPALYYSNVWHTAYLPISSNSVFDRFGSEYDVSRVLNTTSRTLNSTAYSAYSQPYVPATYAIYFGAAFALATAALVHTALYHGKDIVKRARKIAVEEDDVHMKLMRRYPEVPDWWYCTFLVVAVALSLVVACAFDTTLPWWGLLLSVIFGSLYVLPGGLIYALTATQIQINIPAQLIAGFAFSGSPLAVMLFKVYSICSTLVGLSFVQDLKLGHYMKIPPRATFSVQIIATIASALAQVGVKRLISVNVDDFCAQDQSARLNCASTRVFYSASIVWGAVGPSRLFGVGKIYNPLLWGLLIGVVGPILTWMMAKRWPKSWLRWVNLPVALNGAMSMPPATGINYSSWFLFGFIFQFVLRRRRFRLWSRFGYLLSAALDSGTVICAVVIFLTLSLPEGGVGINWWGNTVYTRTLDYVGAAYKKMPESGYFA